MEEVQSLLRHATPDADFFANRAKYFRSLVGRFFCNDNNFLYEFNWRWFNLCYGTQRQTRIFLQTMQNIFAHQLGVFSVTIIISYTSSSGFGSIFATARNARRGFSLQAVQNIFAHQLCVFSVTIIIPYTSSSGGGSIFATARNARRGFCCKPCKIFSLTSWAFFL